MTWFFASLTLLGKLYAKEPSILLVSHWFIFLSICIFYYEINVLYKTTWKTILVLAITKILAKNILYFHTVSTNCWQSPHLPQTMFFWLLLLGRNSQNPPVIPQWYQSSRGGWRIILQNFRWNYLKNCTLFFYIWFWFYREVEWTRFWQDQILLEQSWHGRDRKWPTASVDANHPRALQETWFE